MTSSTNKPSNLDSAFAHLADVVDQRRDAFKAGQADPKTSYTALLFSKGDDAILKKIGEEATEAVMAAKDLRSTNMAVEQQKLLVAEMADLWFHCLIALSQFNFSKPASLGPRYMEETSLQSTRSQCTFISLTKLPTE